MKIDVNQAKEYFAHKTQLRAGMIESPDDLPEWCHYYAIGDVCGAFHWAHWPGVLMGHLAVKPVAWGKVVLPMREIMIEAWNEFEPERIVGWVAESNRAMRAVCDKVGMTIDGQMPLREPVILYGWVK